MILSTKEKEELNKGIYEYLASNSFEHTAEAFLKECPQQLTKSGGDNTISNILEKKWVTISKLQKKIIELEDEVEKLKTELKSVSKMKKTTLNAGDIENLFPKSPESHKFTGHKNSVNKVAFHPMYTTMASIGDDEAIKLWDFEAKKYEGSLKGHTEKINDIDFDPNGLYLASASSDLLIKIWDLDAKVAIKTFTGHDHSIHCVRWKNTGDFLISASRDETIKLWELATGYCLRTYKGHEKWVRMAVFNSNCTKIASGSDDNTIIVWEFNKDSPLLTLYGHSHVVESVMFVNNLEGKKTLNEAKYNVEGKAALEENLSAVEKSKRKLKEGQINVEEELAPLEFVISGSRDLTVKIWSAQTGNVLANLEGHAGWVRGLSLHHSGKFVYSCSDDRSIRIWSLATGKLHQKIEKAHDQFVTDIIAHPVYLVVATCSVDSSIKLWDCK